MSGWKICLAIFVCQLYLGVLASKEIQSNEKSEKLNKKDIESEIKKGLRSLIDLAKNGHKDVDKEKDADESEILLKTEDAKLAKKELDNILLEEARDSLRELANKKKEATTLADDMQTEENKRDVIPYFSRKEIPYFNRRAIPYFNKRGSIPYFNKRGDIPYFNKRGEIPYFNKRGEIPYFNKRGEIPYFHKRGDIPFFQKRGEIPYFNKRGEIPYFNKRGDIPYFNKRGDIPYFHKRGEIPYFNKRGDIPYFNKRGEIPYYERDASIPYYDARDVESPQRKSIPYFPDVKRSTVLSFHDENNEH